MYAQIKNGSITTFDSLPFRVTLADGTTRTSLSELSAAQLAEIGVYPVVGTAPEYDASTQRLVGPTLALAGDVVTASWAVEDLPPEEAAERLEAAKAAKRAEIAMAWRDDIETVGMPVGGYGFAVDYDVEDALIWQNASDFLDPAATEVEVRGIENGFHVIPRALFESIPAAQKAYYAQQLQKKWALQKAVDAAGTVEELEAITW